MYVNTSVVCENLSQTERIQHFDLLKFVGFTTLIVKLDFSPSKNYETILTNMQKESSLRLFGKITVYPNTLKELKTNLKTLKSCKDFFISVQSSDKDILTYAINDSRIDIISSPAVSYLSSITPGLISLLKTNKKHIEISLKDIISANLQDRSRLLHEMNKFLVLVHKNLELVLYGGDEKSLYEIRGPHDIAAIFRAVFDLNSLKSNEIVNSNPERLLLHLIRRGDNQEFSNGVRIQSFKEGG